MSTHGLELVPEPGQAPRLAEPIPDTSLVALDVFLNARLREFLQLTDGDQVQLAGHGFTITGWHDKALILRHACCRP